MAGPPAGPARSGQAHRRHAAADAPGNWARSGSPARPRIRAVADLLGGIVAADRTPSTSSPLKHVRAAVATRIQRGEIWPQQPWFFTVMSVTAKGLPMRPALLPLAGILAGGRRRNRGARQARPMRGHPCAAHRRRAPASAGGGGAAAWTCLAAEGLCRPPACGAWRCHGGLLRIAAAQHGDGCGRAEGADRAGGMRGQNRNDGSPPRVCAGDLVAGRDGAQQRLHRHIAAWRRRQRARCRAAGMMTA